MTDKKENEVERLKATIKDLQTRAAEAHKRELYYMERLAIAEKTEVYAPPWSALASKAANTAWKNR